MLKSNSNKLTFENEIQSLKDQRERQFRKPTYAEVARENKPEEFLVPPTLPNIENMQQQINNESETHHTTGDQQRVLQSQKPEIVEQKLPEYQLNMIETEDIGVQTDSYISDEQSHGNLETETETSTDEDDFQIPSKSTSRSSLDSDDSIPTSNKFEVLNLDETDEESSLSEKSDNTDNSKDSSESNEIDSESAKKETIHRRKKRKTKKKANANKCTKCEDVTCKKAWDSDLETEKKERQRKNKIDTKTKEQDPKEKNPML